MVSNSYFSIQGNEILLIDKKTMTIKVFDSFGNFLRDGSVAELVSMQPATIISVIDNGIGGSNLYIEGYSRDSQYRVSNAINKLRLYKPGLNGVIFSIKHKIGTFSILQALLVYPNSELSCSVVDDVLNEKRDWLLQ